MIDIVYIEERHAKGFHACLDAVSREGLWLAQTKAPPLDRVENFVRDNITKGNAQFVALDGKQVVGWCDALPHWAAGLRHRADLGMGIVASHRGQGIGTALLTATLEHARQKGISRIDLEVRADNRAALALYKKLGFVEEGRKIRGLVLDGNEYDLILMGILL